MSATTITDYSVSTTYKLDASAKMLCIPVQAMKTGTLSKLGIGLGITSGIVTNIGRLKIVGGNNAGPNMYSVLHDTMVFTPGGGYSPYEITLTAPFNVVAGQWIFILFWNADQNPSSNNYEVCATYPPTQHINTSMFLSLNSGATFYTLSAVTSVGVNLYISGVYTGTPLLRVNNNPNTTLKIYRNENYTGRVGPIVKVNVPTIMIGLGFWCVRTGTLATSRLVGEVYEGATLLATSSPSDLVANVTTNYYGYSLLSCAMEPILMQPGHEYFVVARLDSNDGDENNYLALKLSSFQSAAMAVIKDEYNSTHLYGQVSATVPFILSMGNWTVGRVNASPQYLPMVRILAIPSNVLGGLLVNRSFDGGIVL